MRFLIEHKKRGKRDYCWVECESEAEVRNYARNNHFKEVDVFYYHELKGSLIKEYHNSSYGVQLVLELPR